MVISCTESRLLKVVFPTKKAGDQYELYAVAVFSPVIDFIGNLSNLFLLKGFCYINEVGCMSGFACQIEVAYNCLTP